MFSKKATLFETCYSLLLNIIQRFPRDTILHQEIDRLGKRELKRAFGSFSPLELVRRELLIDNFNFLGIPVLQSSEDAEEEAVQEFHHFVIVFLDCHFEIKADKLRHVPMRKRVLRTEDGPNFVNALKVSGDSHLLGELGRLSQKGATCGNSILSAICFLEIVV
jgi:hypothetical protein